MVDLYGNYTKEQLALPLQWRQQLWISHGEVGISSKTIWLVMVGMDYEESLYGDKVHYDVPYDPSDFRRCYLLLKFIPEWRPRLHEVAKRFPRWEKFVEQWDYMTRLYEEERENRDGKAHKLFEKMQELRYRNV